MRALSLKEQTRYTFRYGGLWFYLSLSVSVFDYFEKFKVNALFAYLYDFDFGFVPDIDNVFHVVYALVGKAGNMNKSVLPWGKFAERADLR